MASFTGKSFINIAMEIPDDSIISGAATAFRKPWKR